MWRRRHRGRKKVVIGCLLLLLIGFAYGYITNENHEPNEKNIKNEGNINIGGVIVNPEDKEETDHTVKNNEDEIIDHVEPIDSTDNIVTNDIQIIFNTYYERTREMLTEKNEMPSEFVGRTFEELRTYLEEQYIEWNIRECNKDRIELYKVTDKIPPNYYIVKEYDGYIAVFQVNGDGESILLEKTEIPISSLSEMDLQYIRQGIIKKEREEINQILEAYSS